MSKEKRRGFTLIELVAVLVIMAILALIVTPLVMNIIRKARIAADKRSVDAYGRSIELAIAGYLLDNGKFPTEVSQLTIEYSGDTVSCETTQINPDSSVYLAGCKVKNRNVEGYEYGTDKSPSYTPYTIGNQVSYNGVSYYVIKNSGVKESTVTLLKAEPLSVGDVNLYGSGHINKYTYESIGTAYNNNGYGGVAYFTSETCGYVNQEFVYSGCTINYNNSDVKFIVDAWSQAKIPIGLKEARLITYEELMDNLGYNKSTFDVSKYVVNAEYTPSWVYNYNYHYWYTMSAKDDSMSILWVESGSGWLQGHSVGSYDSFYGLIRPVIVLDKSVLTTQ